MSTIQVNGMSIDEVEIGMSVSCTHIITEVDIQKSAFIY